MNDNKGVDPQRREALMADPSPVTRSLVTLLFVLIYMAFLAETAALAWEFGDSGLTLRLATLDAHNFIFFPVAGLLALVGFWRPTVLVTDALARGQIAGGRAVLGVTLLTIVLAAFAAAAVFSGPGARSIYEISPGALAADTAEPGRLAIPDALITLNILADGPGGLSPYQARCDSEWLRFSPIADEERMCLPAGQRMSVADCCAAKARFRTHINTLQAEAPSYLSKVHTVVLPIKSFFLLMLLAIGILLVRFRRALLKRYGERVEDVSFGLAVTGIVMMAWPLLNAAYLETMALLTGDGSSGAYTVFAPLIALGFGIWALLLIFFHLRTYPSQIEYAARIGGFIAAAIGVLRYEEITGFLIANLGVGAGIVAIIVFAVMILALVSALVIGIKPKDFDLKG